MVDSHRTIGYQVSWVINRLPCGCCHITISFSNFLPAISILCLAFGLLERDGLLLVTGMFVSAIALAIGFFVVYLFIETTMIFIASSS
jgi:hypothetical protein